MCRGSGETAAFYRGRVRCGGQYVLGGKLAGLSDTKRGGRSLVYDHYSTTRVV